MTGEQLSGRLGWSAAKVSRIETGRTAIALRDLHLLLDLYELPYAHREWLIGLGENALRPGWWDAHADILAPEYAMLIALEAQAESIGWYAAQIVPGLLQTEDYAREIIRSSVLIFPPSEIERRVRVRMTRQRVLTGDAALRLRVVLDETVLTKTVGDDAIMAAQLRHLADTATWSNVDIQVLPNTVGAHPAINGEFMVVHFPEPSSRDVAYIESLTRSLCIEDDAEVLWYNLAMDRLRSLALRPEDSRLAICSAAGKIYEGM
jgi:transcriptional regulator with XRE-family HTH domain